MKNITETLAGRVAILDLLGISYQEKIDNTAASFGSFIKMSLYFEKASFVSP